MFSLFICHCGASCGQLLVSFCAQGRNGVPPGSWGAIRDWPCGNPQLLPAYAQDRCHFCTSHPQARPQKPCQRASCRLGAATAPQGGRGTVVTPDAALEQATGCPQTPAQDGR